MNRFGLRTRLIAAFGLVSILAAALVAVSSVALTRRALLDRATAQAVSGVQGDLVTLGFLVRRESVVVEDDTGRWRILTEEQLPAAVASLSLPSDTQIVIHQPGGPGYRSVDTSMDDVPAEVQQRVREGLIARQRQVRDDRPELIVGGRVASDALEVYRVVDLSPIAADVRMAARTAALAGTVPVLLALLAGTLAAGQVLRPVRRARDAARSIAAGQLAVRVPETGRDELAEFAGEFNQMARSLQVTVDELHTMMNQQRRFVADVAHELRTPLTALTAAVDVLEQEAGSDTPDSREATRLVVDEVRALRAMVEDLMEISRFDAGVSQLEVHEVGLRAVVEGTLRRRGSLDLVDVDVPGDLRLMADPRRLDAIVGNLVDNALHHGARPVRVTAAVGEEGLSLDVTDAGPGIPGSARDHVFERFAKADVARTRAGGSGLGLAIARENARLHGGEVELFSTGPEGTCLRVRLPLERVVPGATRTVDA